MCKFSNVTFVDPEAGPSSSGCKNVCQCRYYFTHFKITYAFTHCSFHSVSFVSRFTLPCLFNWSHLRAIKILHRRRRYNEKKGKTCHNRSVLQNNHLTFRCHHHPEPYTDLQLMTSYLFILFFSNRFSFHFMAVLSIPKLLVS